MLVDSHCHIEGPEFDSDRPEMMERAGVAGVSGMLCIGSGDLKRRSMCRAAEVAEQWEPVDTSIGVHPQDASAYDAAVEAEVLSFVRHPKVVGWGEIGLDYHYGLAERETQLRVFRRQLELAYSWRLPVIIHSRDAEEDTVRTLREAARLVEAGVMHCFGGSGEMAAACLDLGFYISFAGNVTFKKATNLWDVARQIPLERLLVETDAPFLAPVPVRGKRSEPAFVQHVARFLAELRGESLSQFRETTTANYFRLFKRDRGGKHEELV